MLELDGIALNFIKKDTNDIGKAVISAWDTLVSKYELDKGKSVQIVYDSKSPRESIEVTDFKGHVIGKRKVFPSGKSIQMMTKFTDNNGNEHTVMYSTRKGIKAPPFLFTGSHTFTIKDKELFLYLYCFSGHIVNGLKSHYINVDLKIQPILWLEDLESDAAEQFNAAKESLNAFGKIADMDDIKLRRFAIAIGFGAAKTMTPNLLRISVAEKVRVNPSLLNILESFDKAYSEEKYRYDEILDKALALNVVLCRPNNFEKKVVWGYPNENDKVGEVIVELVGTKRDNEQFIEYLKADDAAFSKLSNAVNEAYSK